MENVFCKYCCVNLVNNICNLLLLLLALLMLYVMCCIYFLFLPITVNKVYQHASTVHDSWRIGRLLHVLLCCTASAVGCADLPVISGAWTVRDGDLAIVRCNHSRQVFHLKCNGNVWFGDLTNCTSGIRVTFV